MLSIFVIIKKKLISINIKNYINFQYLIDNKLININNKNKINKKKRKCFYYFF